FRVVRPQVHVHQAPLKPVGNLRAKPVHMIVVPVDAHDTRAVDRSVQYFCWLQISWNENARIKTLLGSLCGHCTRKISRRRTAYGFKPETPRGSQRRADHAILERKRRETHSIIFQVKTLQSPMLSEFS